MIFFFEKYTKSLCERIGEGEDARFEWQPGRLEWDLELLQLEQGWKSADMENLLLALPEPIVTAMSVGLTWVAGGFVRRWIAGEDMRASDIDLFFRSPEDKRETVKLLTGSGFEVVFQCPQDKLTSLKKEAGDAAPILVQCISQSYYAGPWDCISTFDFTVSQFALTSTHLYMDDRSLRDLNSKALHLNSLPFPAATMRRMIKYAKDGYRLTEECALDFLSAVRSDAAWRYEQDTRDGWIVIEGGVFEDGSPAGVREDFNRWYID